MVRRLDAELESLRKDKEALRAELVKLQGRAEQLEVQRAALVSLQVAGTCGWILVFFFA